MIESEYYSNYKGPNLIKATINNIEFTEHFKFYYGKHNNWQGKLWTFQDIFPAGYSSLPFRCDFEDDNGTKHWFKGIIGKPTQIFNHPAHTPINQNL